MLQVMTRASRAVEQGLISPEGTGSGHSGSIELAGLPPGQGRRSGMDTRESAAVGIASARDVGVGGGTPSLYAAFPDTDLVLVDPLVERRRLTEPLLHHRRAEFVLVAAGAVEGTATLNVELESLGRSSLLDRTPLTAGDSGPG